MCVYPLSEPELSGKEVTVVSPPLPFTGMRERGGGVRPSKVARGHGRVRPSHRPTGLPGGFPGLNAWFTRTRMTT